MSSRHTPLVVGTCTALDNRGVPFEGRVIFGSHPVSRELHAKIVGEPGMSIMVETVAEVDHVHRETVEVSYYPPDHMTPHGIVQLFYKRACGELQFISFPADKADALIEAIRGVLPINDAGDAT